MTLKDGKLVSDEILKMAKAINLMKDWSIYDVYARWDNEYNIKGWDDGEWEGYYQ